MQKNQELILETMNVNKRFKNLHAVKDVNMHIRKGQIYGLVGKNGAGKTTLMRLILGLAFPNDGEITLFGESGQARLKYKEKIGALIEQPVFYDNLTAYENLDVHRTLCGVEDPTVIEDILKLVGLENTGKKKAKSFSLGMKQRLGIAQALINEPSFLILDEPVNGLDPEGVKEVRQVLQRLVKEKGMTIMISSHILSELSMLATHYGFMDKGILIEEISADELHLKSKRHVIYEVSNIAKAEDVLKTFGIEEYEVFEQRITVFGKTDLRLELLKGLIKADIDVTRFDVNENTLEDYFLELTGGHQHV